MLELVPAMSCDRCGDDLKDPPLSDHYALCDTCATTSELHRLAVDAMNRCARARWQMSGADYELDKSLKALAEFLKRDHANQGDWDKVEVAP